MAAKKATKTAAKKATKKVAKKTTKKAAKKKATKRKPSKKAAAKAAGPMRSVWAVCDRTGSPVEYYAYRDRDAADEKAEQLTQKKGAEHWVRGDRLPMEPPADPDAEGEAGDAADDAAAAS